MIIFKTEWKLYVAEIIFTNVSLSIHPINKYLLKIEVEKSPKEP